MTSDTLQSPQSGDGVEKLLIILCHLSLLLGVPFLLPAVVYWVKRQSAPRTAEHAKEALNFHITLLIYGIVSGILVWVLIGFVLLAILAVAAFLCPIIACFKASEGRFYRYPLTIRIF